MLGSDSVTALAVNRILADEVWIGTTGGVTVGRTSDSGATYTWTTYTASNTAAGLAGDDIKDYRVRCQRQRLGSDEWRTQRLCCGELACLDDAGTPGRRQRSGRRWQRRHLGGCRHGSDRAQLFRASRKPKQRPADHLPLQRWRGRLDQRHHARCRPRVIWLGTDAGVSVLDPAGTPHNKTDDHWYTYRTTDGLADDRVSGIALGSGNEVWFATDGGLGRANATIPAGTACERAVSLGNQASYAAEVASATDADVYRIETEAGDASLKLALSDPDNRLSLNLYRSCDIETSARRNTSAKRSISARRSISAARPGWSMMCAGSRAPTTPSSRHARASAAFRLPIAWLSPSAA